MISVEASAVPSNRADRRPRLGYEAYGKETRCNCALPAGLDYCSESIREPKINEAFKDYCYSNDTLALIAAHKDDLNLI